MCKMPFECTRIFEFVINMTFTESNTKINYADGARFSSCLTFPGDAERSELAAALENKELELKPHLHIVFLSSLYRDSYNHSLKMFPLTHGKWYLTKSGL